ncbi:MAG: polyprenyl synthetase family protein [Cyanobacteriota bacterium]
MKIDLKTNQYLHELQEKIEKKLDELIPNQYPYSIYDAIRYSTLGGGKRIRAILCIESCKLFGGNEDIVLPLACTIEIIHAQSLIHDDLPCMDDDDYRRGKPSTHKKFGEAHAVLAGDAMIPLAYEVFLNNTPDEVNNETKIRIIKEFSKTIGASGLVGGQVVDVETEGTIVDTETLNYIHSNKTGALYRFSLRSGAILANCNEKQLEIISDFSKNIGLAFQISDDILDIIGSKEKLGKTPGKDKASGKNTYPLIYGLENSIKELNCLRNKAINILNENNLNSNVLIDITNYIADRIK